MHPVISSCLLLVQHFSPLLYLGSGYKVLCNHAGSHTSDLVWTGLNLAKIPPLETMFILPQQSGWV